MVPPINYYETLQDAFLYYLREVLNTGRKISPRHRGTIELDGCCFRIRSPRARLISIPSRRWSLPYALGEMLWHFSASRELDFISHYSKRWNQFSDDGKLINGSCYGNRIFGKSNSELSRWEIARQLLMHDPDTRRCVITMYRPEDLAIAEVGSDLPCCNLLQFLVRDGQLCMIVYMRSNDLMYGFTYDIFLFTMLQEMMAKELSLPLGWYQHVVGSLHIYNSDIEWAHEIASYNGDQPASMPPMQYLDQISRVIEYEKMIRTSGSLIPELTFDVKNYWREILLVLLYHRAKKTGDKFSIRAILERLKNTVYGNLISKDVPESIGDGS